MDLLAEPEAPAAVARLGDLGVAAALHPVLEPDPDLVAAAALGSAETGANPALAALAALCCADPEGAAAFVGGLGLERPATATRVLRAADGAPDLAHALREPLRPSALHALLTPEPPETLALALGLGAPGEPVLRFLADLRDGAAGDRRRRPARRRRARVARDRRCAGGDAQAQARRRGLGTRRGAGDRARARPAHAVSAQADAIEVDLPARTGALLDPQRRRQPRRLSTLNLGVLTDDDPELVSAQPALLSERAGLDPAARRDGLAGARRRARVAGTGRRGPAATATPARAPSSGVWTAT